MRPNAELIHDAFAPPTPPGAAPVLPAHPVLAPGTTPELVRERDAAVARLSELLDPFVRTATSVGGESFASKASASFLAWRTRWGLQFAEYGKTMQQNRDRWSGALNDCAKDLLRGRIFSGLGHLSELGALTTTSAASVEKLYTLTQSELLIKAAKDRLDRQFDTFAASPAHASELFNLFVSNAEALMLRKYVEEDATKRVAGSPHSKPMDMYDAALEAYDRDRTAMLAAGGVLTDQQRLDLFIRSRNLQKRKAEMLASQQEFANFQSTTTFIRSEYFTPGPRAGMSISGIVSDLYARLKVRPAPPEPVRVQLLRSIQLMEALPGFQRTKWKAEVMKGLSTRYHAAIVPPTPPGVPAPAPGSQKFVERLNELSTQTQASRVAALRTGFLGTARSENAGEFIGQRISALQALAGFDDQPGDKDMKPVDKANLMREVAPAGSPTPYRPVLDLHLPGTPPAVLAGMPPGAAVAPPAGVVVGAAPPLGAPFMATTPGFQAHIQAFLTTVKPQQLKAWSKDIDTMAQKILMEYFSSRTSVVAGVGSAPGPGYARADRRARAAAGIAVGAAPTPAYVTAFNQYVINRLTPAAVEFAREEAVRQMAHIP